MHGMESRDGAREIDWSRTAEDYALHRPGFPDSFYAKLKKHNIGLPNQKILDLGTGTGSVAREFAGFGCQVSGIDISREQIAQAKRLAREDKLSIEFCASSAEETRLPDNSFDIIIAAQCWLYFDPERILSEVSRLLLPGGHLVTCHLCWLPRVDALAQATEKLILKHNPAWSASDWDGIVPILPSWSNQRLNLQAMFYYDEALPFTQESWRGRIRASRGIGATLTEDEVREFDGEHRKLLTKLAPETFAVLHRIDAHIFSLQDCAVNANDVFLLV